MTVPDLSMLRHDYGVRGLDTGDLAGTWDQQFARWFDEASGLDEPNFVVLATASADGQPSARCVLAKGVDARGLVFYTNHGSRKGRELAENPRASIVFPWVALERQVVFTGVVERVSDEETDAYFAKRPRGAQIGAWASAQSSVIPGREVLEEAVEARSVEFGGAVPVPPFWGGYRLLPATVEFWQGRPSRLHDRLQYRAQGDEWVVERLSP